MEHRKAICDEAFFYQLWSICHALVNTLIKLQSLCRHMHTELEFQSHSKGPYHWHSIPFIKAQQKDNPPEPHLTAIIYVAASGLFSMQYHFKPTHAKVFQFVCGVCCGELELSSRL